MTELRRVTQNEYAEFLARMSGRYYSGASGICEPPVFNAYDKGTGELIAQVVAWENDAGSPMFVPSHPGREYFIARE